MNNAKREKGIALITLVIIVIVLGILTVVITQSINPYKNESTKTNFETDLRRLEEKISQYYARAKALPLINKYEISSDSPLLASKNINDNENYYVIDLQALNVELYYGKDYDIIKELYENNLETPITEDQHLVDVYIINEQTNTIYYVAGKEYDGAMHYRLDEVYNLIELGD